MTTVKDRIWLVAHDFSTCADAAAELALDDLLDSRSGGRLVLIHVFSVILPPGTIEAAPASEFSLTIENSTRTEVTRALERVAERLRAKEKRDGQAPLVEIEVTARVGSPAEAILEEAAARGATRIVVGTHGRTGVGHLLLGSVAERVVRFANVPVVVAHAPDAKAKSKGRT